MRASVRESIEKERLGLDSNDGVQFEPTEVASRRIEEATTEEEETCSISCRLV